MVVMSTELRATSCSVSRLKQSKAMAIAFASDAEAQRRAEEPSVIAERRGSERFMVCEESRRCSPLNSRSPFFSFELLIVVMVSCDVAHRVGNGLFCKGFDCQGSVIRGQGK